VNIPELSVKKSVTMTMVILIIVVLGIISFIRLGLDLMPDITYPVISVSTNYPGVSSQDIENSVTKPIEEILGTIKNVKKLNSVSLEGLSVILIEFEWGTNLDNAAQDIRDRIDMYKDYILPEDVKRPMIMKFDPSMMPIAMYGVTGERDLFSLRTIIKDTIKDRLEQIDGVASVMIFGGLEKEILVEIKKDKLELYHLNLDNIIMKLRMENMNVPSGYITEGYKEFIIRTKGELENINQIENIVLYSYEGIPVYLKDIATVRETYKEKRSITRLNEKDSVLIIVSKESGANTVIVGNRINKELKKISELLPSDIKLHSVFDQTKFIKKIVNTTFSNAVQGAFLAGAVLFLFLFDLKPTFIICLSIPLSILAAFIPLYFLGHTLNFITMIGIALGVGMLVDNSIVVIENIFRHIREGEDRITASIKGASEVGMAITASTLTTIAVFIPLIFAKGLTGKLFWPLALTVSFTLLGSLFVALTIVPMLTSKLFIQKENSSELKLLEKKVTSYLHDIYNKIITWTLLNSKKVILITLGIFILSILIAIFIMGKEFFPKMDYNNIIMMVKLPVGITIDETNRVVKTIEEIISHEKETYSAVMTIIGITEYGENDVAMGTGPSGVNEAELYILLKDKIERKISSQEFMDNIRKRIPKYSDIKIEFIDMGSAFMTGGGRAQKPVEIKLYGKDIDTLEKISQSIMEQMKKVNGVYDVDSNLIKGKPEIVINIDREKAARYGLSLAQAATAVQTAFQGKVATRLRQSGEEIDIRVRLKEKERKLINDIKEFPIINQQGVYVPLKEIAQFDYTSGPIKLYRENQKRTITLTANVSKRDINSVINEIKMRTKNISIPEGYFLKYSGEFEQMRDTFIDLSLIFALAVLLIYMVMAAEFESFLHPFIIMFTVPLSIIGVIILTFIAGKSISLPMAMGVLILSGVIVNNGIVLIDYINQLRKKGLPLKEAIIQGGITRLRPVLMTALTTILGLVPMLFSKTEGSELRSVVSITLIGGLVVGTFLTLVIIPIIYNYFEHWKKNPIK